MPQRHSGYDIQPNETYITPDWVWEVLYSRLGWFRDAIDPCPPNYTKDWRQVIRPNMDVASNPPFSDSTEIVRHCLDLDGVNLALLLPVTWDCAKSRRSICRQMDLKIVLTERIRWSNLEQKVNGPSSNHAWYIWCANTMPSTPKLEWY